VLPLDHLQRETQIVDQGHTRILQCLKQHLASGGHILFADCRLQIVDLKFRSQILVLSSQDLKRI
jgi:hypothetical protein